MCGIAGFFLREEADSKAVAAVMLDRIEHRGRDATGIAWWGLCDDDRNMLSISEGVGKTTVWHQKAPVPAKQFVKSMAIPTDAKIAIMHTRAATQGKPEVNSNNHPIIVADTIIGVHNGMIRNDVELWTKIGKDLQAAEVDSEVIFGAIYALVQGKQGEKKYGDTLRRLEGGAAVAWLDTREVNRLNIARVSKSPLIIGWTEKGSLFFGSTKVTVEAAAKAADLELVGTDECEEGDLFTFGPEGVEMENFEPPENTWGSGGDWRKNQIGGSKTATTRTTTKQTNPGKTTTNVNPASHGFTDDAARAVQSHSDMLRGLSHIPIQEGDRKYKKLYDLREKNIARWIDTKVTAIQKELEGKKVELAEAKATEDAFDEAEKEGGYYREGDWVTTDFQSDPFTAQIVSMPQSFPGGLYVLRVYVPHKLGGHDTILVKRSLDEFSFEVACAITGKGTEIPTFTKAGANPDADAEVEIEAPEPFTVESYS